MNYLGGTDAGEVAVALIREYYRVGMRSLDARSRGRRPAVSDFLNIHVEIVVREHRATYGSYTYDVTFATYLLQALGYKPVSYAVSASGAVMEGYVCEHFGFLEYGSHII